MDFVEILKTFGFPVALVIYFLWRDQVATAARTEEFKLLMTRISQVEDYQKTKLEQLVEKSVASLATTEITLRRLADLVAELVQSNKTLQTSNEGVIDQAKKGSLNK